MQLQRCTLQTALLQQQAVHPVLLHLPHPRVQALHNSALRVVLQQYGLSCLPCCAAAARHSADGSSARIQTAPPYSRASLRFSTFDTRIHAPDLNILNCCAAAARHSADGSAAAAGNLPSVSAAATSKGAAAASSSAQHVSSAAAANKFSGKRPKTASYLHTQLEE